MKCPKCGKEIKEGAKFCVGCGTPLADSSVDNKAETTQKVEAVKEKVSTKMSEVKDSAKKAADSDFMKMILASLMFLFNIILKPIKTLKAKIEEYAEPKNGFILAGVVALATMIVRVVVSFIMAVLQKQCSTPLFGKESCASFGEKIQSIDWMGITLKHLLIILISMFAVAGIYYIASLLAKKTANFMRLLTITTVSFVPACVAMYLLTPICGWINVHFGVIVTIAGFVYSLVIFFSAIKDEFKFESEDKAVYFHLICVSVILIILYFVGYNVAVNAVTSNSSSSFNW